MRIVAFSLCWILILTAPVVVAQQTPTQNQSWDALRQLQAGEKLLVERKTDKKFSGKLISLSDTELAIERSRGWTFGWRRIGRTRNGRERQTATDLFRAVIIEAAPNGVSIFVSGDIAMKNLAIVVKKTILGLLMGAMIGLFAGYLYYEYISVPKAQIMDPWERETYLCSEGQAPLAFSFLGVIIGSAFGVGIGSGIVVGAKRKEAEHLTKYTE